MPGRIQDKIALITGAGSGIGAAIANRLSAEGAIVIVTGHNEENCTQVVRAIEARGFGAYFMHLDVTDESSWIQVYAQIEEKFGKLHILVNNAGIGLCGPTTQFSLADWRRVMAVNLDGVFLGIKHAIPLLQKSGGGSIINIASSDGIVGVSEAAAYCASKGGVRLLTKAVALECASLGNNIRVNSVHPGSVDTPMVEKDQDWMQRVQVLGGVENAKKERAKFIPLHRVAAPAEIASVVLFLASDDASYMTGSELVVDGGITAQ